MSETAAPGNGGRLADGQWHRLHPATPLLRGGIAFVAILGVILVNLRDVWIEILLGGPDNGDAFAFIIENGYLGLAILAITGGLLLSIAAFYVSWRMHTFRITDDLVEVRSGILFRTHRRGRLDRIQGINVVRPFLARLFGAAKLEISVAGQDANVPLSYLGSAAADELRREILRLASGTQLREARVSAAVEGSLVERRVSELLAPELAADVAPPESVVQMHLGRLIGSLALSAGPAILLLIGGIVAATAVTGRFFILFVAVPAAIGIGGYYVNRFTKSLRYSIAGTPDGIRVGFGLLSTSNETLPPGRIHAIQVSQPLLWRIPGWWEIKINRASQSATQGAAGQANTTILPVGNLEDVRRVLGLILPELAASELLSLGMTSRGGHDGFVNSPPRARVLRWFSRRRNGFARAEGVVLLRRGAIWRELILVPQARLQSVALRQGPLLRVLALAGIRIHTVAGPVSAHLGAIDADAAVAFFGEVADAAITSATSDRSHRWRAGETPA